MTARARHETTPACADETGQQDDRNGSGINSRDSRTHKDQYDPERPTPTKVLAHEPPDHGADDLARSQESVHRGKRKRSGHATHRAQKRSQAKQSHGLPPLIRLVQVRNGAAADGHGRGSRTAAQEAEHEKHGRVRAQRAPHREAEVEQVAEVVDDEAAVHLGHGRDEEGADGEAQEIDADGEGSNHVVRDGELNDERWGAWGKHDGCQVPGNKENKKNVGHGRSERRQDWKRDEDDLRVERESADQENMGQLDSIFPVPRVLGVVRAVPNTMSGSLTTGPSGGFVSVLGLSTSLLAPEVRPAECVSGGISPASRW